MRTPAREWRRLTETLLDVLPLGMSSACTAGLLKSRLPDLDGRFGFFTTATVDAWTRQLSAVVSDLGAFLTDASAEVISARTGDTAQDEVGRMSRIECSATFGAARRHDVDQVKKLRHCHHYRAWTLCGRLTRREAQAPVRRAEVLSAEDEVRALISFVLAECDAAPVAWAGNEFLLDVPVGDPEAATAALMGLLLSVKAISQVAGKCLSMEPAEAW